MSQIKIFNAGDRIRHFLFGSGTITATIRLNKKTLYKIGFDSGKERLCRTCFLKKIRKAP
ncbi:MAG: hypothetical protein IJV00_06160 [Clostridia bacterium]|nr:hypothetical protein [Clostridia bacterium]